MMSQIPGPFTLSSPEAWAPEEYRLAGQTGGRGRKNEGRGNPTYDFPASASTRCNEPALPPPFLAKAGAGLRKLSLSAAQPTFDPTGRPVAEALVALNPPPFMTFASVQR